MREMVDNASFLSETGKCQAAYFIVVLHDIRSVVIAVRGTETPEDLITDGLCRETALTMEDLDGLIKQVYRKNDSYDVARIESGMHIDPTTRETVVSSFPHYGHSGIVESARELYHQIEGAYSGSSGIAAFETSGFLSSLLGAGCECDGYAIRIVGHSLGGAIGALLGIRLYGQIPNLHVYAYGPLPCVDLVVADACSGFITSIVHDTEFSSFLSVNSILRLRAAALTTISHGSTTDTAMISKLAQLFLNVSKNQKALNPLSDTVISGDATQSCANNNVNGTWSKSFPEGNILYPYKLLTPFPPASLDLNVRNALPPAACEGNMDHRNYGFLHDEPHVREVRKTMAVDLLEDFTDFIVPDENLVGDPVTRFLEAVPSSVSRSPGDPPEVFLPGVVIHLIRKQRGISLPLLKGWGAQEMESPYKAIIADRENFKEILISPSICHYALQRVCESRKMSVNHDDLQFQMV
ncbi:Sn1-specific diacylglycerol lipase alpha [Bienertia sinuspersici]